MREACAWRRSTTACAGTAAGRPWRGFWRRFERLQQVGADHGPARPGVEVNRLAGLIAASQGSEPIEAEVVYKSVLRSAAGAARQDQGVYIQTGVGRDLALRHITIIGEGDLAAYGHVDSRINEGVLLQFRRAIDCAAADWGE